MSALISLLAIVAVFLIVAYVGECLERRRRYLAVRKFLNERLDERGEWR